MRGKESVTLGEEDSFVDVGQAAGEEGAKLDEVFNRNAFLLDLDLACCTFVRLLNVVVGAGQLHRLS